MKKLVIHCISLLILYGLVESATTSQFGISFGICYNSVTGSNSEYIKGGNDFPVIPSHWTPNFGLSFSKQVLKTLGLQATARYYFSSQVIRIDPSDNDSVETDTPAHLSVTLNTKFSLLTGKLCPYLLVGGGFDIQFGSKQTEITVLGYEVEFSLPDKTISPLLQLGIGCYYRILSKLSLLIDLRYIANFTKPNRKNSLDLVTGIEYNF